MTTDAHRHVSVGNWMLTMFLMTIPLINIILLFVWAFGSNTEISKANWAKAALIWGLISILFYIAIIVLFGGLAAILAAVGANA